jgi:Ca2+-binding RTX toxin-like protein
MTTITTTSSQSLAVANLYIALFDRAPDAAGFEFWNASLAQGASLTSVTEKFLTSPEGLAIYPASQNADQFVTTLYETVFSRSPDAGGLAFWTNVLNNAGGAGSVAARAAVVTEIIKVVSTPMDSKPVGMTDYEFNATVMDREIFANKGETAIDFAVNLKSNDLALAKEVLANIGHGAQPVVTSPLPSGGEVTPAPVETSPVAPAPTPMPAPAPALPDAPKTLTLTTGTDDFKGGSGNDTFNAPAFYPANSLNTYDRLDGGAGYDTLNVRLTYPFQEAPTITNIEAINVTASTTSVELDLRNSSGFEKVGFVADRVGPGMTGLIKNVGDAELSVSGQMAKAGFSGSTATELSLTLNNAGTASRLTVVDLAQSGAGADGVGAKATSHDITIENTYVEIAETVDSAAVTSVTLHAGGTNVLTLSEADARTVKDLTIHGNGAVDLTGRTLSTLETLQYSDGILKLKVDALSATSNIKLGAGDDVIILARGSAKGGVVDGGAGDDRIVMGEVTHFVPRMENPATGDVINPGVVGTVDTVTGGAGKDTFVFTTSDVSSQAGQVTAIITDFRSAEDSIVVTGAGAGAGRLEKADHAAATLEDLLIAANDALDGATHYYVGQVQGDAYLVTDIDGVGYTNVIKLAGVGMDRIAEVDLIAA